MPYNTRPHLPALFALCAFMALSMLLLLVPVVASTDTAFAASNVKPALSLVVSPTTLTNCQQCTVTLSNQSSNRLGWFAYSHDGISGVSINPQSGTLRANHQVTVSISIPSGVNCPASVTITFNSMANGASVFWNCTAPTPTPIPPTPTPSPTPSPTPVPTPTPIAGIVQQNNGNPPANTGGGSGSSALSILLSVGALLLGLFAFTLYLIPPANSSVRTRLLALILPASFLRRPPPQ